MAITSTPACAQCSTSRCSSMITTSAASTSTPVSRWIEENSRPKRGSRSSGSVFSCATGFNRSHGGSRSSFALAAAAAAAGIEIRFGLSDDEVVGKGSWNWQWGSGEGFRGWLLGLAMAGLLVAGEVAALPGEAQAASRLVPRRGYDPVSEEEREASSAFAARVTEALELLDKGRKAQAKEDFVEALRCYSLITQKSGDLALAEYARVGRALTLYEVGDRAEAIAEMEDMSLSLKGYPEVHAALAAALYADKHAPVPAEQQFTFATLLDRRYTDPSWVKSAKHWPPSLIVSLQLFIALK